MPVMMSGEASCILIGLSDLHPTNLIGFEEMSFGESPAKHFREAPTTKAAFEIIFFCLMRGFDLVSL